MGPCPVSQAVHTGARVSRGGGGEGGGLYRGNWRERLAWKSGERGGRPKAVKGWNEEVVGGRQQLQFQP